MLRDPLASLATEKDFSRPAAGPFGLTTPRLLPEREPQGSLRVFGSAGGKHGIVDRSIPA